VNRKTVTLTFLCATLLLCTCAESRAQTTILNTPSTDVVASKKVYVEMDFLTNYAWQRESSFQNYIPRTVIGMSWLCHSAGPGLRGRTGCGRRGGACPAYSGRYSKCHHSLS